MTTKNQPVTWMTWASKDTPSDPELVETYVQRVIASLRAHDLDPARVSIYRFPGGGTEVNGDFRPAGVERPFSISTRDAALARNLEILLRANVARQGGIPRPGRKHAPPPTLAEARAVFLKKHAEAEELERQREDAATNGDAALAMALAKKRKRLLDDAFWPLMAEGLAEELERNHLHGVRVEVSGPVGVASLVTLDVYDAEGVEYLGGIGLRPGNLAEGEMRLVDWTKDTQTYPSGTVGAMNYLNHPTVPLPSVEDVAHRLRRECRMTAAWKEGA